MRNGLILVAAMTLALAGVFGWLWQRAHGPWDEWEGFAAGFVQQDGRVVDRTANSRSTSEGQAYALFFALVANDRMRFDRILAWTRDNLCEGDLARRLPAWLWGQHPEGNWGVLDSNPASDADLWIAYALMEAGRLWDEPGLAEQGRVVLWQIKSLEIAQAAEAGMLLVPGPQGFRLEDGRWRLNPSYYTRFHFDYFAKADPAGPWREVWSNYQRLLPALYANGYAPDWFALDLQGQPQPDPKTKALGSYDAIRVYLWAGMSAGVDRPGLQRLAPFAAAIRSAGAPPEFVDTRTGAAWGGQPLGFSGAVLPYLKALGEDAQVKLQQQRLRENRVDGRLGEPAHYYDQVLALFGQGWLAERFRFETDGRLKLRWESLCCGL